MKRKSKHNTNKDIRHGGSRYCRWTRDSGRWWKRKLSKARRKYTKDVLKHGNGKEPTGYESTVNYRNW